MPKTKLIVPVALLAVALASAACGKDGADCRTVRFMFTPSTGGAFDVLDVEACTHAPADDDPSCVIQVFDIAGTDRYFQYTRGQTGCIDFFDAIVGLPGEAVYYVGGTPLRAFGDGTGNFASGTYTTDTGASGTFAFHEFEFHATGVVP